MIKTSMSNTKYIIFGEFKIDGIIDKPDLIGSFFGQTEGLIGEDLEFNSLQKNGKLGRIDINLIKKNGKSLGKFSIPTALNKVEVSLVAAAIESIEKIGHCNGKIVINSIKDDREDKRKKILARAESLLSKLKEDLPDTAVISEKLSENYRKKLIKPYFKGEYFGGPNVLLEKEIILVEGRADVINLLKNGIFNIICFNGSNVSKEIVHLCENKIITVFLDGDRGGRKELDELIDKANVDFYCFAPEGKGVEDLNYKEIMKCLKNKVELNVKVNNEKENYKKNSKNQIVKDIKNEITQISNKRNIVKDLVENIIEKKIDEVKLRKKDYFSKKEFEKILGIIENIKNKKEFYLLNKSYRKIFSGNINEILSLKKRNGKILILDGICEGSILKKAENLDLDLVIARSKSKFKNNYSNINVILFENFYE
ncbi:MAG: DNA primase [Nanoarchaeota archaeon]|nr:DNA primase [Nanoarchaeota archaeon]